MIDLSHGLHSPKPSQFPPLMPASEDLAALADLFVGLFTDSESLRRFVATTPGTERLVIDLPDSGSSIAGLAHRVACGLESHGLISVALFERLRTARPNRVSDIATVARRFGTQMERASALPPRVEPTLVAASEAADGREVAHAVPELLHRFTCEPGGRRRLLNALQEQTMAGHDPLIARRLADAAQLQYFLPGSMLIEQDGTDTDILLILAGRAAIAVNGREVAVRRAGQHIGEMAMIDPAQRRSATIIAHVETVVARISEDAFVQVAEAHPILWRRLALELGVRLRERGRLVRPRNARPVVFLGSTLAGLPLAREFEAAFKSDHWDIRVWPDGAQGIGKTSPESLMAQLDQLDFGVLVLAAADLKALTGGDVCIREALAFQAGLLLGTLGRDRTLVVKVRGADGDWLPSAELGSIRCLDFVLDPGSESLRRAPVVDEIRVLINHHTQE